MADPPTLDPIGLAPILELLAGLDLADPDAAAAALAEGFPPAGPAARDLEAALRAALAAGRICDRGAPPVRYSRLFRAAPESRDWSADVVLMDGAGPRHTHPAGEVSLGWALAGEPRFDGHPPGWVVYGPGSTHAPTVTGGTMFLVYFLPGGAIQFHPEQS